ncbi:hypothetical protein PG985_012481 [Apiospora marii]|uniref:uncharacterized protein n=1 Tax=Apiospora marii TaxID=335849 RepID=UPI003130EF89
MVKKQTLAAALLLGTNAIANPLPGNGVEPAADKRAAAPETPEPLNLAVKRDDDADNTDQNDDKDDYWHRNHHYWDHHNGWNNKGGWGNGYGGGWNKAKRQVVAGSGGGHSSGGRGNAP